MKLTVEERFWAKVNKDTDSDCWEWTAALCDKGYGRFGIKRKVVSAHRLSVILDGRDPTGLFVCHHCDNTKCVRPDHLFLGTQQDNMRDMLSKKRNRTAPNRPMQRRLIDVQIHEIRNSKMSQRELSRQYNVSQNTIFDIIHRHTYRDVT